MFHYRVLKKILKATFIEAPKFFFYHSVLFKQSIDSLNNTIHKELRIKDC